SGEKIVKAQLELIARAEGMTEEQIAKNLDLQDRIFSAIRTGEDTESLKEETGILITESLDDLSEEERAAITDVDAYVEQMVKIQFAAVESPWYRFFLDYDPAVDLEKITCPLLAVWGEFDLQVPAEENRARMEEVLTETGHPDYTLEIVPHANHLFQETETGAFSEYAELPKEFVPGFLDLISDWLVERLDVRG
ncbi:alpha/beta hydrolase, partial [bacterium]|nr:alpha/beta hydrolase [bacterium]